MVTDLNDKKGIELIVCFFSESQIDYSTSLIYSLFLSSRVEILISCYFPIFVKWLKSRNIRLYSELEMIEKQQHLNQ